MSPAKPNSPAHDWRGMVPPDRPHYPRPVRWVRGIGLLMMATALLGSLWFHRQTLAARTGTARADAAAHAADARTVQAEATLAAAAAREARAGRLLAWLQAHPPLQPLVIALFDTLAQEGLHLSELSCQWDQPDAPATLRLAFRAPANLAREVLAALPEAAQSVGWRLVPIRQEQDPASGETFLQAALAPATP